MKIFNIIVNTFAKVGLPIALIFFGWTQYKMTAKFDEEKLDKELMLKFIEISWSSLNSNDTVEIRNAIRLLGTIDPKYSIQLLEVLRLDSSRTEFIFNEIKILNSSAQEGIINDMEIEIYLTANSMEGVSSEIKSNLMSETQLKNNDISEIRKFRAKSMKCNNEIIYSDDVNYQKVKALHSFLNGLMKQRHFELRKQNSLKGDKILINLCN